MAALEWEKVTWFPNGVNQGLIAFIGGAAGDHTVPGIRTTDKLAALVAITFNGGNPSEVNGLLTEFEITADNTLNNTGGTDTSNRLILVQVVLGYRESA